MHITVTRARAAHLEACAAVFDNSPLHERYFTEPGRLERMLTTAIGRGELWMAACASGEVVGVMWVDLDGFFGGFPYLALLGVKKRYRGNGVGHTMLRVYEGVAKALGHRKISLMVSHFNPRAKSLYQSLGYRKVGYIPDAFAPGIDENIMVKSI